MYVCVYLSIYIYIYHGDTIINDIITINGHMIIHDMIIILFWYNL